jgi:hypothetical protein
MNAITTNARIRIHRRDAEGKTRFLKEGTVIEVDGQWFRFHDDHTGRRAWMDADPTALGATMTGWTQTYEVI